jgi:hypothetical protein
MSEQSNNPKNNDSPLFRALTKFLSGPITRYQRQNPRQLKRWQLDKYKFTSPAGLSFKKTAYSPFDNVYSKSLASISRSERYVDFDQMEYTPEIASAIDIYADEMTTSSPLQQMLNITCPNEEIKSIIHTLFYSVLNIEFNLYGWARTMCKYGDYFLYLDIDEDIGVKSIIGLPPQEIERLEGEDKTNPDYVQFQWNSGGLTFENWQIAHFRILGNDKFAPYGTSVLEPARRIWRQLTLLEDAMMAYRVVRSPERRVFYIDVGGIPESDVEQHMQRIVTQMKRNQVIDSDTGRVDLRYNPMSTDEDYFIPVRGGQAGTRIESLPGGTYTGDIDDVKYLRDKLFSALKIPASYLTQGEESTEDKTTLAQKDIRFSRTITRLQRNIISELEKITVVHLYTLGFRGKDLLSFKLSLNQPSKIAELQELEHWRTKFDIATAATEGYFSRSWVSKNIFGLTDDEIVRNQREMYFDRKLDASLEAVATAATEDAAGGMGGDMGGDLGGDDLGGDDLGGDDLGGGDEAATEEPAEDDSVLLSTPGNRNQPYLTPGAKGKKYTRVNYDGRKNKRQQNMNGQMAREKGKNTQRNVFPGLSDLSSLAKGIYEQKQTTYMTEENSILKNNEEINQIIEVLNKKDNNNDKV